MSKFAETGRGGGKIIYGYEARNIPGEKEQIERFTDDRTEQSTKKESAEKSNWGEPEALLMRGGQEKKEIHTGLSGTVKTGTLGSVAGTRNAKSEMDYDEVSWRGGEFQMATKSTERRGA